VYYVDVDSADEIIEVNSLSLEFVNKVRFQFLNLYNFNSVAV
jgi:hypothetical protein